jgi:hypothetical protein
MSSLFDLLIDIPMGPLQWKEPRIWRGRWIERGRFAVDRYCHCRMRSIAQGGFADTDGILIPIGLTIRSSLPEIQ